MEANANLKGTETPDALANHETTGKGALDTDRFAKGVERGIDNLQKDASDINDETASRLRAAGRDVENKAESAEKSTEGAFSGLFGGKSNTESAKETAQDAAQSVRGAFGSAENKASETTTGVLGGLFGSKSATENSAAADASNKASQTFGSTQSAAIGGDDTASTQPSLTERIFGSSTTSSDSRSPAQAEREAIQRASDTFGSTQTAAVDSSDLPGQGGFGNRAGTNRSIGDDVSAATSSLGNAASNAVHSTENAFSRAGHSAEESLKSAEDRFTTTTDPRVAQGYVDADSLSSGTSTNTAESAPFSSDHGTSRIASTLNPSAADVHVDRI